MGGGGCLVSVMGAALGVFVSALGDGETFMKSGGVAEVVVVGGAM